MAPVPHSLQLVAQDAAGPVLACAEGLSFWGGVDPDTGRIIDAHHPNCGALLSGQIVLMPTSRGSCSGSGVLLQLARNGRAPAALVFSETEDILTLGAMIAQHLFARPIAVLRLDQRSYDALARCDRAEIRGNKLHFADRHITLDTPDPQALQLNEDDLARLGGEQGVAQQIAMQVLCRMAAAQGATRLTDVTRGHIDGCILAHDANLDFAEKMRDMEARVSIPTTINAISVDRLNWQQQGVPPDFGTKASRLADAYVEMGAKPTFTCAPYQLGSPPAQDEHIGWSESNAVIYANSVLGARTQKHPDYLDLFIAMTGRAPCTGVYLSQHRLPGCEVHVTLPPAYDDSLWPLLGWLVGHLSPNSIPRITGLAQAHPGPDDLKALCAAFGTTSGAPLLHIKGHTPEGHLTPAPGLPRHQISSEDLLKVWQQFNPVPGPEALTIDLVAIGSPHASLAECHALAAALDGQTCRSRVIVTVGRHVLEQTQTDGTLDRLQRAGVQVVPDLCWCSITEPVFPSETATVLTNSGKFAHYGSGLTGRRVRFGSLATCATAAVTGLAPVDPPEWLKPEDSTQRP